MDWPDEPAQVFEQTIEGLACSACAVFEQTIEDWPDQPAQVF